MYENNDHTFAICAYKDSAYLETCLQSVLNQDKPTHVIICTATPNDHILSLAETYQVPLHINTEPPSIAGDWNYACSCAKTSLVTIAHQDDIYLPYYSRIMLYYINRSRSPLIFFSDYEELRKNVTNRNGKNLRVKRMLLKPLARKAFWQNRFVRERVLSLGSSICCPSVTLIKDNVPKEPFNNHFECNLDWEAWTNIAKLKGSFVYCPQVLMQHRIHDESETTRLISNNKRSREDLEMLERFWPRPIAKIIHKAYTTSQDSNKIS